MSEVNIYPNLKKTIKLVKARFSVFNYLPFTSCQISVQLFDEADMPVETRVYQLDNTNGFQDWSSDDRYLESWVRNKLQEDQ